METLRLGFITLESPRHVSTDGPSNRCETQQQTISDGFVLAQLWVDRKL